MNHHCCPLQVMSSELDWDDTMHSEVGCSSDTSSNATPESDESERNSVMDEEQDLVNVQHVSCCCCCCFCCCCCCLALFVLGDVGLNTSSSRCANTL